MKTRHKVVRDRSFSHDERLMIRAKSNGLCAHCGQKLSLSEMTVEHVIPKDKGGTHDMSNLVALCMDCNVNKDNFIYHPSVYYPYLNDVFMDELIANQQEYYKNVNWLTPRNFMPEDVRELPVKIPLEGKFGKNGKNLTYNTSVIMRKAAYSDLDTVFDYIKKYNKKYLRDDEWDEDFLKKTISEYFNEGCMYLLLDKSDKIRCILPIMLLDTPLRVGVRTPKYGDTMIFFENFITLYDTLENTVIALNAMEYLKNDLASLHIYKENIIVYMLGYNSRTSLGYTVTNTLGKHAIMKHFYGNDEHNPTLELAVFAEAYKDTPRGSAFVRDSDYKDFNEDMLADYSNALKERFGLNKVKEEKSGFFISEDDVDNPLRYMTIQVSKISCPKGMMSSVVISMWHKDQYDEGKIPPLPIDQNFKLLDYPEFLVLYRRYGDKTCRVKVEGRITKDLSKHNVEEVK